MRQNPTKSLYRSDFRIMTKTCSVERGLFQNCCSCICTPALYPSGRPWGNGGPGCANECVNNQAWKKIGNLQANSNFPLTRQDFPAFLILDLK